MYPPTLRASARSRIIVAICFAILFFFNSTNAALGQESILVDTQFSSLSVLDLASQNLTEVINAGLNNWSVAVGPNPRLAFVGTNGSITVIDLTIGREVKRIGGVYGLGYSAFTPDGKFLLLADNFTYTLDVIDAVGLRLVRKVNLAPTMGAGAANSHLGSIVVVGTKAYVTTTFTDPNRPAIAVVDLKTFVVRPIKIQAGYFDFYGYTSPNAAATPDGQYVVMVEDYNSDFTSHVLLISTKTNQVVHDFPITNDPTGLLVTPVNQAGSVYGYVLGFGNSGLSATVLDLNPLSPTFGQLLPATEVVFQSLFSGGQTAAAINAEGTKLAVGGYKAGTNSPNPNLLVIDTGKMFTDPTHAIVGQATVAGGTIPIGITVASVMTTPPLTAPTVTNVSGPITNNVPNTITVTGSNFAAGALVRIGTTPPLPATVNSSTSLQVTVPQNAPAQANLDVIVTNPDPGAPQAQQFQSGLLPGGLTINVNPAFQPLYQFAALDLADRSVSVYEPSQGTMIHVPNAWVAFGITFNGDGAEIYGASTLQRGFVNTPAAVAWNPANDSVEAAVLFPGARTVANFCCSASVISASVNPATGNAVVFVPVRYRSNGKFDVALEMADTDSSSPTFNQVIQTIPVGLNSSSAPGVYAGAATPDGRYVYVDYLNSDTGQYSIAIFDVVHGTVTTVSPDALGVANVQYYMTVTPDGQSLLMTAYSPNPAAGPIAVLDIGTNPQLPASVTTITGTPPGHVGGAGAFYFVSWQVVGNRLFGLDAYYTGAIAVFNFDRSKSNFSQLAARFLDSPSNLGNYLGVSPDGARDLRTYI